MFFQDFRISGFQDSASYFQSINLSREIFCRKQLGTVAPSIPRMVMSELCSFENKFSPVLHVKKRSFAVHLCLQYLRKKRSQQKKLSVNLARGGLVRRSHFPKRCLLPRQAAAMHESRQPLRWWRGEAGDSPRRQSS